VNILFVHEVDWLRKVCFEIHTLPESLSARGHNVFMVDFGSFLEKNHTLDFGTLKTKEFNNVSKAHAGTIDLIRPGFIKAPLLDRASALFTHYFEIKKIIREKQIDAIVLYSVPTNGLQTIKLAKNYGVPVVFRSIDVLHMLVMNEILKPPVFFLEKWAYSHVDRILTLSPKLSDYVIRMGADEDKVELLLFGVDMSKFNPNIEVKRLRSKLGIDENSKVIVFIGTLFEFSGVDSYLKQFPAVLEELPEAKLVIVGGGALLGKLKDLVVDMKLTDSVILTGFQPFDIMPQYINLAGICINPFVLNMTTRDIIPGKVIQYLSCAKPVLATPLPGMTSQFHGPKHGVIYSRIAEFAENTIKLLKDAKMIKQIGENGYGFVKKNHDQKEIAKKLETILRDEISRKSEINATS
jgi:glycosyltransferase involved in cell wall biosynthesis